MRNNLHSEITSLDILLNLQIQVLGLNKIENASTEKDEFAMLSENYLDYAE